MARRSAARETDVLASRAQDLSLRHRGAGPGAGGSVRAAWAAPGERDGPHYGYDESCDEDQYKDQYIGVVVTGAASTLGSALSAGAGTLTSWLSNASSWVSGSSSGGRTSYSSGSDGETSGSMPGTSPCSQGALGSDHARAYLVRRHHSADLGGARARAAQQPERSLHSFDGHGVAEHGDGVALGVLLPQSSLDDCAWTAAGASAGGGGGGALRRRGSSGAPAKKGL